MFRPGMILMLALLATPVGADVYKWTDAQGKVHYGDRPPTLSTPKPFNLQASEAAEARAAEARRQVADETARKRLETGKAREAKAAELADRATEAQRKAENCQRARGNLELLQRAHMRLSTVDARGHTRMLDVAARQAEVERANRMISENCE
jgi:hypothetical protein